MNIHIVPVLVSVFMEQTSLYPYKSFGKPGLFYSVLSVSQWLWETLVDFLKFPIIKFSPLYIKG